MTGTKILVHATVHPEKPSPRTQPEPANAWGPPEVSNEDDQPPEKSTTGEPAHANVEQEDMDKVEFEEPSTIEHAEQTAEVKAALKRGVFKQVTPKEFFERFFAEELDKDGNLRKPEESPTGLLKWSSFSSFNDSFGPIDPQKRNYITWLFVVTLCYSYNAWCVVLRATFPYQTPQNTPSWMAMDYLCDLVYLIDVALVKPRLMYLHHGFWVNNIAATRRNYRRKLQYKFDLASLMPLDILYLYFGPQAVILRFPRLMKLQTFWEFHTALDRIVATPYTVRIGKTLFYIFYLIHVNACGYYGMSAYEGIGSSNEWVYNGEGNAYIRCFYFATKTATSIGKNPKPENTAEYMFMTVAWLMGVFVFALLVGQIRDIIATATKAQTDYKMKMDLAGRYLRQLSMPVGIQRRVGDWCTYTWSQQRCFDESKILNSLPINMKRDVALSVHMNTLSKVKLFQDCSPSLLRDLVLNLKSETFLPGDVIVRKGDVGHNMYFVKSGECCVMGPSETEIVATLREGAVFGEVSLMDIPGLRRRTATVRSRGYSNLFALSKQDLDAALKHHKEAAQVLRRRADQIVRENAARDETEREEWELGKAVVIDDMNTGLRRRRPSNKSSSSGNSSNKGRKRSRLARTRSSKLETVAENAVCPALTPAVCDAARSPMPSTVFSSE